MFTLLTLWALGYFVFSRNESSCVCSDDDDYFTYCEEYGPDEDSILSYSED